MPRFHEFQEIRKIIRFFFTTSLLLLFFFQKNTLAQPGVITVGLQYKPLVPSKFFRAGEIDFGENKINYSLSPKISFSGGMVIRRGFSKLFSLETGINYVKRNLELIVSNKDISFESKKKFSIVGYEVPTLGLIYIRLAEQMYMNAAFGFSIDFFPSDVGTNEYYFGNDIQVQQTSIRNHNRWVQPSLLANLGYEYRTTKRGIFYFGSSFHRPFSYSYQTTVKYFSSNFEEKVSAGISGNYLTFDFRYFFHQDPKKKNEKKPEEKNLKYFENLKKRAKDIKK